MATCVKCESVLQENSKFCPNCGEAVLQEVIVHINDENVVDDTTIEKGTSFKKFYFSSEGRIGKKEFLFRAFFPLTTFNILLMVLIKLTELLTLMDKIETNMATVLSILIVGLSLVISTSIIFTSIKRFHDLNMSGWWSLLTFILFINFIVLLWLLFSGSKNENNRYGTQQSSYSLTGIRWFFLILQLIAFIVLIVVFSLLNQFIIIEQNNSREKSVVPVAKQEVKQIDSALTELERFTKACDGGDADGCFMLGNAYSSGKGVEQNYFKAVELWNKACDGENADGCFKLGNAYFNGQGVEQDSFKAVELWNKACDGENAEGCYTLGFMYTNGRSVRQDDFKAVELYQKACDGGNTGGCVNLGVMYFNGQGIKQNYFKAVELWNKACDGENADGCFKLGFLYYDGKGIKQNSQKALELYGKACDMKLDIGCENYAKLKKQLSQ